jgi:hypothetical protein
MAVVEKLPGRAHVPAGRDHVLDLVRSGAIALVVVQHWLMPVIGWDGTSVTAGNALTAPAAWVWTWIGQVMPLVFFAAGAAGAISLRRRPEPRAWLAGRVQRLVLPVFALVVVWLPLPHLLVALGTPEQPAGRCADRRPRRAHPGSLRHGLADRRPVWIALLLAVLCGLVRAFGRWETGSTGVVPGSVPLPQLVTGIVLAAAAMPGLAARGFAPGLMIEQSVDGAPPIWPLACTAALVTGYLLATRTPVGTVQAGR